MFIVINVANLMSNPGLHRNEMDHECAVARARLLLDGLCSQCDSRRAVTCRVSVLANETRFARRCDRLRESRAEVFQPPRAIRLR